jgi:hypothetical protein
LGLTQKAIHGSTPEKRRIRILFKYRPSGDIYIGPPGTPGNTQFGPEQFSTNQRLVVAQAGIQALPCWSPADRAPEALSGRVLFQSAKSFATGLLS